MGNIGVWQLLIVAVIVILLFGTKKLRNLGGDLGSAIKGFKKAVGDEKVTDEKKSDTIVNKSAVEESTVTKDKDQV